jgi:hypothetical protein
VQSHWEWFSSMESACASEFETIPRAVLRAEEGSWQRLDSVKRKRDRGRKVGTLVQGTRMREWVRERGSHE